MIIWQGWGLLVAVITFASSLVFEIGTESYFADDTYYQTHAWPLTTALLAAAVANWAAAQLLERRGGRVLIDPQTGETVVIGGRHTLFFVPMRYWSVILAFAAMLAYFAS